MSRFSTLLNRKAFAGFVLAALIMAPVLAFGATSGGSGGGGSPGGSDTEVQFNDGGTFGGDAELVYDKTTNQLTVSRVELSSGGTVIRDGGGFARVDGMLQASAFSSGTNLYAAYPIIDFESRIGICWSSSTDYSASNDVCLYRDAAGILEVTDGSTGNATIKALVTNTVPGTTPGSCNEGDSYYDSTDHDFCDCVGGTPAWRSRGGGGSCSS